MIDATLELAAPFQESLIREQLRLLRRYSHSEGEPDAGLGRSERHTQCPDTTLGRLTVERVSLISRSTKLGRQRPELRVAQPRPFRDPDLPEELLPDGWTGRVAHEVFTRVYATLERDADGVVEELAGLQVRRKAE